MGDQATGQEHGTTSQVAGFWRRFGALFCDSIILAIAGFAIGFALYNFFATLGSLGRLFGFVIALIYFVPLESKLGGGQSLGKKLLGIRVVGRDGSAISLAKSTLRYSIFAAPYFLNGVYFNVDINDVSILVQALGIALGMVVFAGGFGLVYLIIFNRRTRQSLHDVITGTFVIRVARTGQPVTVLTPRLHLYVVSGVGVAILAAVVATSVVLPNSKAGSTFADLRRVSKSAESVAGVRNVKVQSGFFSTRMASGNNTNIHFLQIAATVNVLPPNPDRATNEIAAAVLGEAPDLLGNDTLVIVLTQGFDIGLAAWNTGIRTAYPKAEWEKRIGNSN